MRLCFIEDTRLHGGTQIWVVEAVRYFLRQGDEVVVLSPGDGWVAEQCRTTEARIVEYDFDRVTSQSGVDRLNWIDALCESELAVYTVHPPRHGFHASLFAAQCILEEDLQTHLVSKTGTIVPEYLREYYLPEGLPTASVIAISDFTRRTLIEMHSMPQEKVVLIYQGIDLQRFHPTRVGKMKSSSRYPLPDWAAPILGCVGSIEARKGQAHLIEALASLAAGPLPDVYLLIVGDGPEGPRIRQMVEDLHMESRVGFFPFTTEPQLAFEQIDLTVLPSVEKEGLPNVLQESLAMCKPVIASDLGSVSEVVLEERTGLLVKPGDAAGLAGAIGTLWSDKDALLRMGEEGRRLIEARFDRRVQFDQFRSHFRSGMVERGSVASQSDARPDGSESTLPASLPATLRTGDRQ